MTLDRSEAIVRFIPWGLEKAEPHSIVVQLAFYPRVDGTIVLPTFPTKLSIKNKLKGSVV